MQKVRTAHALPVHAQPLFSFANNQVFSDSIGVQLSYASPNCLDISEELFMQGLSHQSESGVEHAELVAKYHWCQLRTAVAHEGLGHITLPLQPNMLAEEPYLRVMSSKAMREQLGMLRKESPTRITLMWSGHAMPLSTQQCVGLAKLRDAGYRIGVEHVGAEHSLLNPQHQTGANQLRVMSETGVSFHTLGLCPNLASSLENENAKTELEEGITALLAVMPKPKVLLMPYSVGVSPIWQMHFAAFCKWWRGQRKQSSWVWLRGISHGNRLEPKSLPGRVDGKGKARRQKPHHQRKRKQRKSDKGGR